MKNCPQTDTQNVLEHGLSVWEYTKKIIAGDFTDLKIPDWFKENHRYIVNNLHKTSIIKNYNIYHDCGKPYCIEYNLEGSRHFPNHENVSYNVWRYLGGDEMEALLMKYDMAIHKDTAEQIIFYDWSRATSFTLMVTSLAELHSNAEMFGGIDSISFKIKYKKWEKRAKMLLKRWKESEDHPYCYVIVRNDLPNNQKAIQGVHAALEQGKPSRITPSVIYVVVRNEKKLKRVIKELLERDISLSIFREPDEPYNDSITAICTEPLEGERREYLKKFMLY